MISSSPLSCLLQRRLLLPLLPSPAHSQAPRRCCRRSLKCCCPICLPAGAFLMSHAVLPHMPPGDAAILHISSSRAHQARGARFEAGQGFEAWEGGGAGALPGSHQSCSILPPRTTLGLDVAMHAELRRPLACMLAPCAFFPAVRATHRCVCSGQGGAAGADPCPGHQLGSQSQVWAALCKPREPLPLAGASRHLWAASAAAICSCCSIVTRFALPPWPHHYFAAAAPPPAAG
jgi:NAD(P)-dependent dehydrogenase (short-subunit alcohol dehydrogenase family)